MTVQVEPTIDKEQIYELINRDLDARRYFFHKADERWLDWLWRNGFLDAIKEEAATPFTTRTPEFDYLLRMAEKRPAIVVDIMLDTPISTDTRSQEVAYGFLRICSALPADQLARVVPKIRTEGWIPLVDAIYTHSSFECEEMLKTLADERYFESLLVLAEAGLVVRPKEELDNTPLHRNNPFYLEYLPRTGIFSLLASLETEYAEAALALAIQKLSDVLITSDDFWLLEVDFFTLQLGQANSWQEEVRELAAVIKTLAVRLIGKRCDNAQMARNVYVRHFESLLDHSVIRRLKFFVLSLCPSAFKDHLKQAFFSLFEADSHYDVLSGTEYEKALREGFHILSVEDKIHYVEAILKSFDRQPEKSHYGSPILSMILPYLNELPDLKEKIEEEGFILNPDYEPRPDIDMGDGEARLVSSRAPVSQEEFGQLPLAKIAKKLRYEWTPANLNARNTEGDFYNPMNASGVGDRLQNDMPERLQEYVDNATLFFERESLDQHYTYAFLIGILEAIRNHREVASEVNWEGVIDLCWTIKNSGEDDPFPRQQRERSRYDTWIANWDAVLSAVADTLRVLLTEKDGSTLLDFNKCRDRIFSILNYLFAFPEPFPEDIQIAIHTVRGKAFEALVQFVFQDGRKFNQNTEVQISDDVKEMYEIAWAREKSRALLVMFGKHLPIFYFRDRVWIRHFLPRIFPQEPAKKHLYSAAWKGYLSRGLYEEMFFDPAIMNLYWRGLKLPDAENLPRKQDYNEPGARLAVHLALAFMHYIEFGMDHQLFEAFWDRDTPRQHTHFINFIGRSFISKGKGDESFEFTQEIKNRLRKLWGWLLQKEKTQEVYKEFGLWINLDKGIFDPTWLARRVKETLEKTNGILEWRYELLKSAPQLAQAAPEETLEIARLYLLQGGVRGQEQGTLWHWDHDNKWIEAFEILHSHPTTKAATTALINRLVGEGGRAFWPLKKILVENP